MNGSAASARATTAIPNHLKDGNCARGTDSTAGSVLARNENADGGKRGEVGRVPQE